MKALHENRICIVCGKEYKICTRGSQGKRSPGLRGRNTKTCCPKCSKIKTHTKREKDEIN